MALLGVADAPAGSSPTDYSIWLLEYGRIPHQRSEAAYSGYARPGSTLTFPFTFLLVRGGGRVILVDCGLDASSATKQRMAAGFGLESLHSAVDVLAAVGIGPDEVDVIIPTHAHWDHMGSLRAFPRATVVVQRAELAGWRHALERPAFASQLSALDPDDIAAADDVGADGRLVVLDGEVENLLPGIHIWVDRNGHSHASQLVLIESGGVAALDHYIAVGDVAYRLENLIGLPEYPHFIPNTTWAVGGAFSTFATYERILDYVGADHHRILIEHDEQTWRRHATARLASGLRVAEVRLAVGERSLLSENTRSSIG